MPSRVFEILREERLDKKKGDGLKSKQLENTIRLELLDRLKEHLYDSDAVEIEVDKSVLGEFYNILTTEFLAKYEFEQISESIFRISDKSIDI